MAASSRSITASKSSPVILCAILTASTSSGVSSRSSMASHLTARSFGSREMIRYLITAAFVCLPLAASYAQPDEGPPRWAANIARKQQVIMHGLPRAYAAARDLSPDTRDKMRRGAALFERHCAACHGWNGQGGGPEAFALVPAPADLEWLA